MTLLQVLALRFLVIDLLDFGPAALTRMDTHLHVRAQDSDDVVDHLSEIFDLFNCEL